MFWALGLVHEPSTVEARKLEPDRPPIPNDKVRYPKTKGLKAIMLVDLEVQVGKMIFSSTRPILGDGIGLRILPGSTTRGGAFTDVASQSHIYICLYVWIYV